MFAYLVKLHKTTITQIAMEVEEEIPHPMATVTVIAVKVGLADREEATDTAIDRVVIIVNAVALLVARADSTEVVALVATTSLVVATRRDSAIETTIAKVEVLIPMEVVSHHQMSRMIGVLGQTLDHLHLHHSIVVIDNHIHSPDKSQLIISTLEPIIRLPHHHIINLHSIKKYTSHGISITSRLITRLPQKVAIKVITDHHHNNPPHWVELNLC